MGTKVGFIFGLEEVVVLLSPKNKKTEDNQFIFGFSNMISVYVKP
jgi:hypothetical protein